MSKRNLVIIALILVVVAIATQLTNRSGTQNRDEKIGKPVLAADLVESFDEIILQSEKGTLHLLKEDNLWTLKEKEGYPVDMKKLLGLVDKLTRHNVSSLVTKDKNRLEHFKLIYRDEEGAANNTSGSQMVLKKNGEELFRMIAGKSRQSKSSRPGMPSSDDGSYIRIGKGTTVYLTKETLRFETEAKEWIQTTLFKLDRKEIESISYSVGKNRFKLTRLEKGKELVIQDLSDQEQVKSYERSSLLSDLEEFKIDEVIDRASIPTKELQPQSTVTVGMYDNSSLSFQVYRKLVKNPLKKADANEEKEFTYFVTFDSNLQAGNESRWKKIGELSQKWLFKMDDWKAKRWIKKREDFIETKGTK